MAVPEHSSAEQLALVLRQCLREGLPVEIDGLGTFQPSHDGSFEFLPRVQPKVFIAYVDEDLPSASRLYHAFAEAGLDPWLDKQKLLPGQNWPRAIEQAMEVSDFVVACFSRYAVSKRGHFQCELRYALDCARRLPLDHIFLIPVRLDDCPVPAGITRQIQYVDLFPDWARGFRRILSAIRKAQNKAKSPDLRLAG